MAKASHHRSRRDLKKKLGNSELKVSPLALGANVFGWTADEQTSYRLLDRFVGSGFNLIDTADSYSKWVPGHKGGESETIIGKWLKRTGNRRKVIIATKVGSEKSLQTLYNLYDRSEYETGLQQLCLENGLGVLTYCRPDRFSHMRLPLLRG